MKDVNQMSEQQVVEELKSLGIQVKYKPVALVPEATFSHGGKDIITYEMDIYDTLSKFRNKKLLNKDPFKE